MLYLEQAKKTLASQEISQPQFIKIHLTVEGIIKRLLFIGLRKNGVQYKTAQQAIAEYYESNKTTILEKAWNLCGIDYQKTVSADPAYKTMENLFLAFSSKYRNILVHGNDGALHDIELVKTLIQVDKKFIQSIEFALKNNNKPSFFEPPKAWGIKNGTITDIDEVYRTLLQFKRKNGNIPLLEDVKKQLSHIKL